MQILSRVLILFAVIMLVSCGIGMSYIDYEDDVRVLNKDYYEQYKKDWPDSNPPYQEYLSKEPLKIIEIPEGKIHIYNRLQRKRDGLLFIFIPLPIQLSDVEAHTEVYIRDNFIYQIIFRNGKKTYPGFGFVCSPQFGQGPFACELL